MAKKDINPYDAPQSENDACRPLPRHTVATLAHAAATMFFIAVFMWLIVWLKNAFSLEESGTNLGILRHVPLASLAGLLLAVILKEFLVVSPQRRRLFNRIAILATFLVSFGAVIAGAVISWNLFSLAA